MRWIKAMAIDELWDGEMTSVFLGGKDVLLVREHGEVHAFLDRCPHKGTPLGYGALVDGVLTCQTHNWKFDASSGKGINPASACLTRFKVKVEDDHIYVDVQEKEEAS